jgi:hypothetical protein
MAFLLHQALKRSEFLDGTFVSPARNELDVRILLHFGPAREFVKVSVYCSRTITPKVLAVFVEMVTET